MRVLSLGTGAATLLLAAVIGLQDSAAPIKELRVRIVTQDFPNAGFPVSLPLVPAGQVWVDLGPQAWQLRTSSNHVGDPFKRGASDEFVLCGPPAGCNGYTTADLLEIRLEKKGLGGFTGAEDGPDGGWMPKEVTLFVDGKVYAGPIRVLPNHEQLDKSRPAWRHLLKPGADAVVRFMWGLRAVPNSRPSTHLDEIISGATTLAKQAGISGWQPGPIPNDEALTATVEGELYAKPSPGTDGFVSLDLKLSRVIMNGIETTIDSPTGIPHARYIRIEYLHGGDTRYQGWTVGTKFRVTGPVKWDTDRDGFYELHPTRADEITVMMP